ncbi:hypothetical protein BDN72DRAFT_485615 [Pluteus cervinus]|uniref:Uncharacterized protein n=1 Tax=Pluteus cervinus TaxID=181527 RepID=A0ACD3A563_9AGAR|nr:hypothetical protein BDN72DRAFT_485615 [Pluteus cervinus]
MRLEIEYEIFMISCRQDPAGRMNLLLVSKRVSEWIIPILYEVIDVAADIPRFKDPPLEVFQRYGRHVKHMMFFDVGTGLSHINQESIIQLCPNVSDLVLWFGSVTTFEIFNLHLNRLTIPPFPDESDKFETLARGLQKTDEEKYRKWCESVTHFAWPTISLSGCQLLCEFPNLTHFLMGDWDGDVQGIVDYMVKWCKGLKVLVVLLGKMPDLDTAKPYVHDSWDDVVFGDVRVVIIERYYVLDWIEGAKGRDDLWEVAERTVEERRNRVSESS